MSSVFRTYLLAQLPGWMVTGLVVWALHRWSGLPAAFAGGLLAVWIIKDLLLFPVMRRFYQSEPAARRMVGETGETVTPLAPVGLVRVRGELWQARSDSNVPQGVAVRVRDIDGLMLEVTTAARSAAAP